MKVKKRAVLWGLVYIIIVIVLFYIMENTVATLMFSVFVLIFGTILLSPQKNTYLIFFMIAFFVFLMGRPMVFELGGEYNNYFWVDISPTITKYTYTTITISLISIYLGYLVSDIFKLPAYHEKVTIRNNPDIIRNIRTITQIITFFLWCALFIVNIEKIIYVFKFGYLESYITYSTMLPGFIPPLADLYPMSFALYLSTLPDKKECKPHIYMHVFVMMLYLLTGRRYETVSAILLILLYYSLRNKLDKESWITSKQIKKILITSLIAGPVIIIFLISMESWRLGSSVDNTWYNLFVNFFSSIGGSSTVIGFEKLYHEELVNRDVWFSFGNIWRSLTGNFIAQFFGADPLYDNNTIENALYGHSLGSAIMYKINPSRMLAGGGIGSCYIAELMCDFSYPGLIAGNFILGLVIKKLNKLDLQRTFHNFCVIFIAMNIFRIPRDSFDFFFYQFFGIKNILYLLFVYIAAKGTIKHKNLKNK